MDRYAQRLWQLARLGAGCLAWFATGLAAFAQDSPSPKASSAELTKWLADLDSESFEVREAAAERLAAAGPAAIDVLAGGVVSDSAEIAWRSGAALERIAVSGDEATLARVAGILDGLSAKGKPGLRSMAGEMHVRQKRFRHDRAVASLKKNGAVFAADGVQLGGGPIFMGGAMAIAVDAAPFDGPVIVEDVIEAAPEPAPAADGIFGLLGRLLEGAVKIPRDPPPRIELEEVTPVVPAEPVLEVKDIPAPPPVDVPGEQPREEKIAEPAETLEEFQELSKPPLPEEPIEHPAEDQFVAPPPALPEPAEILEGDVAVGEIGLPAMGFDFIGGGIVDFDGEVESESSASLVLGTQWRGGDEGLKVLKDVPEIWSISVSGAKITDASLPYIAELPHLANLQVRDANLTREGLQKLRKQKPELQIQARGEGMLGVNADVGVSPLTLTSVFPDAGAYQAGLREGDVILSVDGVSTLEFSDLTISIYGRKAGDKVRLEYEREGAKKTVEVTLKKRRDDQ
jgi:hypothetical protein